MELNGLSAYRGPRSTVARDRLSGTTSLPSYGLPGPYATRESVSVFPTSLARRVSSTGRLVKSSPRCSVRSSTSGSVCAVYRILVANQAVQERCRQRPHPQYTKFELMATAPTPLWSWELTKMLGHRKWTYSLCTAQLLADLGVTRSFSRPQVCDDSPLSEAQFKTPSYQSTWLPVTLHRHRACYGPHSRSRFSWCNTEHRHGGICMLTPHDVHYGRAPEVFAQRQRIMDTGWAAHPERFVRGVPKQNQASSRSDLDQATRNVNERRNCSPNRENDCLKVVDGFREPTSCSGSR